MHIPIALLFLLMASVIAQEPNAAFADPLQRGAPVPEGAVAVLRGAPIAAAEFIDELTQHFLRPNTAGIAVLEAQERELLLRKYALERAFDASESEVDQRIAAIEAQLKPIGKDLASMLASNKVTMVAFRTKTRGLVLLEKLARDELKIPAEKPIENFHCNLWLKQASENNPVERDRTKLPAGAISRIADQVITAPMFAKELVLTLPAADIVKVAETLLQLKLTEILLNEAGIKLTQADLDAEWQWHTADFERDPAHGGVRYADMVLQVQGCSKEEFMQTRAFKVRAALSALTRKQHDEASLQKQYEVHASLYGPTLELRHLLVRCSDDPAARGKLPTLAEGETRLKAALSQLDSGVSFADIARLHSDDLSTKANGGLMPPVTPGRYSGPPLLIETALTLELGAMSVPFSTAAGWHVVRLEKSTAAPPLAQVRDDLLQVLGREMFREHWNAAEIGINLHLP